MKEITKKILTLIISIVLILLILEGVTRLIYGNNLKYDYTKDTLWELKPNQQGFTYPNQKIASINSLGLRGNEIENKNNTIIILGDSFIFGYAIGDKDTIPENLEKELPNTEVINAGIPGYNIEQMINLYKKKFQTTTHKIIILSFIKEDIYRQKDSSDYNKKMLARKLIRSSTLISFLKPRFDIIRSIIIDKEKINFEDSLKKDQIKILKFNEELKKHNKTLILFPYIYKEEDIHFYNKIQEFAINNQIKITNNNYKIIKEYNGKKEDLKAEDSHPSEIQTKLMAEFLKLVIIDIQELNT